jgi:hypothetical protein
MFILARVAFDDCQRARFGCPHHSQFPGSIAQWSTQKADRRREARSAADAVDPAGATRNRRQLAVAKRADDDISDTTQMSLRAPMPGCQTRMSHNMVSLMEWEIPRLCRGGSRSLTFSGVVPGFPLMKLRIVSRQSTRIWSSINGRARKPKPQQVGV